MAKINMNSTTRLQLDSFDDATATLTTTASIRAWKGMVKQAEGKGGNFYILYFKQEIEAMLREAALRYEDSAKDAELAADRMRMIRMEE